MGLFHRTVKKWVSWGFLGLTLAALPNPASAKDQAQDCQLVAALGEISDLLTEAQNVQDVAKGVKLRQIIRRMGRELDVSALNKTLRGPAFTAVAKDVQGFVRVSAELSATGPIPIPFPHLPAVESLVNSFVCATEAAKPNKRRAKAETMANTGRTAQRPSGQGWPYSPNIWKELMLMVGLCLIGGSVFLAFRRNGRLARRSVRYFCHIPVRLILGRAEFETIMLDLSQLGAKIRNPGLAKSVNHVVLQLGEQQMHASVAWANPHFVGLTFNVALQKSELALILGEPKARSIAKPNP